jgi:hypothetical protein
VAETPESPASPVPPAPAADPARGGATPGSPSTKRRVDRRILAVLAAVVIIAALLAFALPQFLSSTPSKTIWQEITAGITDGTVPKQTALEAFAYVFKTDIPGVTVPKGQDAGDVPTSSSGVMRWVKANWDALTPAQQAVINRYTAPQPGAHFTPGETLSNPANRVQLAAYRPPAAQPPQPDQLSFPIDTTVAPDAPGDLALAMAFDVEADIAHIGPKLNMSVLSNGGPLFPNITLTLSDLDGGNGLFLTQAISDGFGNYLPCHITAWKNLWSTQQAQGDSVSPVLHDLITHEVIHCYQNVVWGSVATALAMPTWITEGTAIYLSADDTQVAEPMMQSMWQKGYYVPETPLTNRSYDAYGYYSLLAHEGRDMWNLMLPAWTAAAASGQRSDAFIAVLKGDEPDIRNNWAESYADNSAWGDPWQIYGLFAPHPANVFQHPTEALLNDGTDGSLDSRSNTLLDVNTAYGEVVVVNTDGLASVTDGTNTKLDFTKGTFCVADQGCTCPDGTELAGQDMAPDPMSIPFTAAMNAPEGGSHWNIASYKLDDLCHKKETPRPSYKPQPQNPCGASCSNSNGDPHMLTVNRYRYDFQAAGEFTLLRSTDGSVDIQARQEPFGETGQVSINTAVATKVGDHRVGVYFNGSGLEAHVDGAAADFSSGPIDLGNGGSIAPIAKGFEIDFPDGTKLWALSVGHWGINAEVKPSAAIATTAQGLLGEVAPGGLGVPNMPDGTRLPAATSKADRFQTLYGQFADAWRITDATSLFDYEQGKNTESYTIKPFPTDSSLQSTADLTADQRAAGESACGSITDQGLLDDCIYDVAVTGQAGFADSYTAVQEFYDSGVQPPSETPSATPEASFAPVTPPPGTVSEGWKVPGVWNVANFAWGDNDTVYVSVQTGDQSYALMHLDPVNQQVLAQVEVPVPTEVHYAAGSVWLPALKTDTNGNSCSVTRFDGQTLAEQATIAVPCGFFGHPEMASDGTNIWFADVSKYDLATEKGAVMTELDPTTNAPSSTSVPLPFINGYRIDSQGAFFYFDTDPKNGYYRLTTGAGAFESLGGLNSPAHPAGTGLWVQSQDGQTAQYFTSAGSPQATVQIGGSLLTGDASGVYAEVLGNGPSGAAEEQLWRYPIDGSTPTEVATAPLLDGQFLSYFGDPLPIDNGDGLLKYWNIGNNLGGPFLLIQWVPVK